MVVLLQPPSEMVARKDTESFDEFRKSILDNYNDYRTEVLSRYGEFLDSVWVEYPQYAGVERNPFPKPKDVPAVRGNDPEPQEEEVPPTPDTAPVAGGTPTSPTGGEEPRSHDTGTIDISFFGIRMSMKDVDYNIPDNLSRSTASDLWKYMYNAGCHEPVIHELKRLAESMNLNDYLIFELTGKYADAKFRGHTPFSRNVLTHFLLSNMGYDIRLAESESGTPLLLLPFNQMVYARPFLNIDGQKYFVFSDASLSRNESIYTCFLPSDLLLGTPFELRLNGLRLPYKPYHYQINYGGITLTGVVNANMYPILYRYPQMPIADYACSVVDSELRTNIVNQLTSVLVHDSTRDKAEKLLHFTQSAFAYATDDDNHGFEKPYFFEEMVYYPKCDCEDRAIFYSYLLFHVAGIENHIISYPGHEAASLTLPSEQLQGTSYTYDGKTFFISDPTYIGASTGMCMPDFENTEPVIDYIYRSGP